MPERITDIAHKQIDKAYNDGMLAAFTTVTEMLHNYAQQFGDSTNARIALMVAAEGIRDLGKTIR